MKQYLFFCDSDEGRFTFLKVLAKTCALQLDGSKPSSVDQDQDIYRFRGQIGKNNFCMLHPLSSIDGLKNFDAETTPYRALILIRIKKPTADILINLINSAQLLGYQEILVMGTETQTTSKSLKQWQKWSQNFLHKEASKFSSSINFSPVVLASSVAAVPEDLQQELQDFFSLGPDNTASANLQTEVESNPHKSQTPHRLAEICWLGAFPFDADESLTMETKQNTIPVRVTPVLPQPTRIGYGESARVLIHPNQQIADSDNLEHILLKHHDMNQAFVLRRNGVMICRGRWIGASD